MLIEKVLHGIDINLSAIHLAASTLAMANPQADFKEMQIYRAKFGVMHNEPNVPVYIGSPGILNSQYPIYPKESAEQVEDKSVVDLSKIKMDLIIMNPPFSRADLRHDQLSKLDKKRVKDEEKKWIKHRFTKNELSSRSSSHLFIGLARYMLKENGRLAVVMPFSTCTAASALELRKFIFKHWHIEYIITSHDPRRIFFSENTTINEFLLVAHRRSENAHGFTTFINLYQNPKDKIQAYSFLRDLEKKDFSKWGQKQEQAFELMQNGDWTPAAFYSSSLTKGITYLKKQDRLSLFNEVAEIKTTGAILRNSNSIFQKTNGQQDMRAMYYHKTDRITRMRQSYDTYLIPNPRKKDVALVEATYKEKASRLLIPERFRFDTTRLTSILADEPVLGSAWMTVIAKDLDENQLEAQRALCLWLNSTPGILSFKSVGAKTLAYPYFSKNNINTIRVPDIRIATIRDSLAKAQKQLQDKELKPIPLMNECPVRQQIDKIVIDVLELDGSRIQEWRLRIIEAPSIQNKKAFLKSSQYRVF